MQTPLRRASPCTLTMPSLILCPRSVSSSCSSCSLSCLLFPSLLLSLRISLTRLVVLCPLPLHFVHLAPGTHSVRSLIPAGTMPTTRATGTTSFRPRPPLPRISCYRTPRARPHPPASAFPASCRCYAPVHPHPLKTG